MTTSPPRQRSRSGSITLTDTNWFVDSIITPPDSDGCASRQLDDGLDLIFTDIIGVKSLASASGPHVSRYRFTHSDWLSTPFHLHFVGFIL